ncbi:MAG: hypothetical protein Q7R40_10430 [Phaeospirillum sp.]|nr:hypothetical protein [Phaeospirillum sp.]
MSQIRPQWDCALVAFSGHADQMWLRLLRPGFRHCFLVLGSRGGWLCLNPLAHRMDIMVLPVEAGFDVSEWYRTQGLTVIEARLSTPPERAAPWRPLTCVEVVKRVLGISAWNIVTPWQLYRYIKNSGIKSLTSPIEPR